MKLDLAHLPALDVVRERARARNAAVLLVGGAVRDVLLGRAPHDLDFAVRRGPIALARDVADALGAAFYVMDAVRETARVIAVAPRPFVLDFALCRGDSWGADLRSRDFTINAIAADIDGGELIDPLNGRQDLADRVIRLAGPSSIEDDPVRALRAVRMAMQFSAVLAPETAEAARRAARALHRPSAERLRDEFMAMLSLPEAPGAAEHLHALGLLTVIVPELKERAPEALAAVSAVRRGVDAIDCRTDGARLRSHLARTTTDERTRAATLALAALLSPAGEAAAVERARRMRLSAAEVRDVRAIVVGARLAAALTSADDLRAVHAFMLAAGECAPEAALLSAAQGLAAQLIALYFSRYTPESMPPPLISGDDVLALGMVRGPAVGRVLDAVREAQLIGEIGARPEALALAERLARAAE